MADDKMEISIKGVVFRGSAKQFERSIGQIVQMVAGQNGVGALPLPHTTLPQLPPATPAPQPPLAMRVETDTSMREEDDRRFDAHHRWREQDYATPPRSLPYASPLELVPSRSPAPEPQAPTPDTTNQLLELRQLLELIAFNNQNQTLVTPTEATPTEPKQDSAARQTIDLDALVRQPPPTATEPTLMRRRRRLRKKILLWFAEAIASLAIAYGAYLFFQTIKTQETVTAPVPSTSSSKPAPISSPKTRSQPHHPQ